MDLNMDVKQLLTPEVRALAVRVGLGLLLLLVAVYALVLHPMRARLNLETELAGVNERITRQQALMPAWLSISGAGQNATQGVASVPKAEPVPRTRVYLMPEQMAHMARAVGVEPLEVTLNPGSLAQDPSSIQAQGVFSGSVEGIRELLLSVARMPSLARMERVELRAADGRLELLLQVRIALAN